MDRTDAWLKIWVTSVLVAAFALIAAPQVVPGARPSVAVIIALLVLAGTGFKAVASMSGRSGARHSHN